MRALTLLNRCARGGASTVPERTGSYFRRPIANMPHNTCALASVLVLLDCSKRGSVEVRVLVALEDEYRAYREVLAAGVQALRPGARVATTVLSGLEKEMARFDPQVIISSRPDAAGTGDRVTWIELPTDPSRPTVVSFGGRSFEQSNPTLDALLDIVDEAGQRPRQGTD